MRWSKEQRDQYDELRTDGGLYLGFGLLAALLAVAVVAIFAAMTWALMVSIGLGIVAAVLLASATVLLRKARHLSRIHHRGY